MKNILDNNLIIAIDKDNNPIKYLSRIKHNNTFGTVDYNHDDCRFVIKWDDGFQRNLTQSFASLCNVFDNEE